jgi:hypothetical protein
MIHDFFYSLHQAAIEFKRVWLRRKWIRNNRAASENLPF